MNPKENELEVVGWSGSGERREIRKWGEGEKEAREKGVDWGLHVRYNKDRQSLWCPCF